MGSLLVSLVAEIRLVQPFIFVLKFSPPAASQLFVLKGLLKRLDCRVLTQ
eukprot:m.362065 g.362065  ORF g.362065 m.362065 type:complete len:50 (-) comp56013_c0_seq1:21-170(-)